MALDDLKSDPMMAHLIDSLSQGKDIGHYGRLTFIMIARHFLAEDELVEQLTQDKDCSEEKARGLVHQVMQHGYNPPRRERILEWNERQDFPICPDAADPDSCNVYKNLQFPQELYDHISEYHEEKAEAGESAAQK